MSTAGPRTKYVEKKISKSKEALSDLETTI